MICLRRVFFKLVRFVAGTGHCAEQVAVEFPTVEARADVLGAVHSTRSKSVIRTVASSPIITGSTHVHGPSPSNGQRTLIFQSSGNSCKRRINSFTVMLAILNARSCKRNSPLVPICAGGKP